MRLGAPIRREFLELVRTHRLLIAGVAFFLLGTVSPLTAKFMPVLLDMLGSGEDMDFYIVMLRPPGLDDAVIQYAKNFGMFPLLVILMCAGSVSGDFNGGVAPMILSKPVTAREYVGAKVYSMLSLLAAGLVMSGMLFLFYCAVLFEERIHIPTFAVVLAGYGSLLYLFVSFTVLASAYFKGYGAAAGAGIGLYFLLMALGQFDFFAFYLPPGLLSLTEMVKKPGFHSFFPIATTIGISLLFCYLAAAEVRRRVSR